MEVRNRYIFKKQVLSKDKLHCQAKNDDSASTNEQHN